MLARYMRRMLKNTNLEIKIEGSSCCPQKKHSAGKGMSDVRSILILFCQLILTAGILASMF